MGNHFNSLNMRGSFWFALFLRCTIPSWIFTCNRWINLAGYSLLFWIFSRTSVVIGFLLSKDGCKILAAATASCMARLIPTPPTGDMACAASPMHSKPSVYHFSKWSIATLSSLISFQSFNSVTRSLKNGEIAIMSSWKPFKPFALMFSRSPFMIT